MYSTVPYIPELNHLSTRVQYVHNDQVILRCRETEKRNAKKCFGRGLRKGSSEKHCAVADGNLEFSSSRALVFAFRRSQRKEKRGEERGREGEIKMTTCRCSYRSASRHVASRSALFLFALCCVALRCVASLGFALFCVRAELLGPPARRFAMD